MSLPNENLGGRLVHPNEIPMDLITEIQRVIVKVNDLLKHKDEAEYLLDLIPSEVIKCFGRERVVEAARIVLKESVSQDLSEKFSALWKEFGQRYFDSFLMSFYRVEIRYMIEGGPIYDRSYSGLSLVELPASSEPILVERMLEEMMRRNVPYSDGECFECYRWESNRLCTAGAPMSVKPDQRQLSAEEFVSKTTREPNALEKEWLKHQGDFDTGAKPPKPDTISHEQAAEPATCSCAEPKAGK